MTLDEAKQIVALLNASFPRDAMEHESVRTYTAFVAELQDRATAVRAAREIIENGDHLPSISELRAVYKRLGEWQPSRDRRELEAALGPRVVPEWVNIYGWLRWVKRDFRVLPQMMPHVDPTTVMSQAEYDTERELWVAAGSPAIDLLRAVQMGGFSEDVIEAKRAAYPLVEDGTCEECLSSGQRWRFGKFQLCYLCVGSRLRAGAKLAPTVPTA